MKVQSLLKGHGDTKLSESGCILVIFFNFFSGIWDTFHI